MDFRANWRAVGDSAVQCPVCHKEFSSAAKTQQHLRVCVDSGRTLKVRLQRLTEEQKPQYVSCEFCDAAFRDKKGIRAHMKKHVQVRRTRSFKQKQQNRPCFPPCYACDLCGESFLQSFDCEEHRMKHCTPKPGVFACAYPQCVTLFENTEDLKRHRKKSHKCFNKCVACGAGFFFQDTFRNHECGQREPCPLCARTFRILKLHIKKHKTETPGIFKCSKRWCKHLIFDKDSIRKHSETEHPLDWDVPEEQILPKKRKSAKFCYLCAKGFTSHSSLKSHVAEHLATPGMVTCLYQKCPAPLLQDTNALRQHIRLTHKAGKRQLNTTKFHSKNSVPCRSHDIMRPKWRPFKCDVTGCLFSGATPEALRTHKDSSHALSRFACCYCGMRHQDKQDFKVHLQRHQADTPSVVHCLMRSDPIEFSLDLIIHLMKHMEHYKSECDVPQCAYISTSFTDLQVHKKRVHRIWPLKCPLCLAGFDESDVLSQHLEQHETDDLQQVKCTFGTCDRKFCSAADLQEHAALHLDACILQEGQFPCDFPGCQFACVAKSNLDHHKRSAHDVGLWKCQFCDKIYKRITHLNEHNANIHGSGKSAVEQAPEIPVGPFKFEIEEVIFD